MPEKQAQHCFAYPYGDTADSTWGETSIIGHKRDLLCLIYEIGQGQELGPTLKNLGLFITFDCYGYNLLNETTISYLRQSFLIPPAINFIGWARLRL
jgi:hypothetical protein